MIQNTLPPIRKSNHSTSAVRLNTSLSMSFRTFAFGEAFGFLASDADVRGYIKTTDENLPKNHPG
jgi:hypothetical protein